jgi:hypothetical protein
MFTNGDRPLPAIIIVAFNRPQALQKLLDTIARANYQGYEQIPLLISIDFGGSEAVKQIAHKFDWCYGEKQVIEQPQNLGLRKHILSCGDRSAEFGAVIVLEDDLMVSPAFYDYAVQAAQFYAKDDRICGISLYAYDFNEHIQARFISLNDGYDNYFMQLACSWGQLWTRSQWQAFRQWHDLYGDQPITAADPVPPKLLEWSPRSWKKYFIKYMVLMDKYFVYPQVSLATNSGDRGTNQGGSSNYQVPLLLQRKPYKFSTLDESTSIYDSYYELKADCLKQLCPDLQDLDFECDFYGTKPSDRLTTRYLLSMRDCSDPDAGFALSLLPQELNVVFKLEGDFFHLALVENFGAVSAPKRLIQLRHLHKNLGWQRFGALSANAVLSGLKHKLAQKLSFLGLHQHE